jgi:hypothetical protein
MIAFLRSWFYPASGQTIRPCRRTHALLPASRLSALDACRSAVTGNVDLIVSGYTAP